MHSTEQSSSAANHASRAFLFMVSNAQGSDQLAAAVAYERVLFGFAGAGGTLEKGVVRYSVAPRLLQPTTLGELDGTTTPRLARIANEFRRAGFHVALESRMDAWQKTHEAWVSPVANAIYAVGGDNGRLRTTRDVVVLTLRAIRENFAVLRALEVPITPPKLRAFDRLPEPLLVPLLQRVLASRRVEILAARHANAARDEMAAIVAELSALAAEAGAPTPAADELARYVDASVPPLLD